MLNYIVEVSFSWLILYLGYLLFLKETNAFYLNRAYLLLSLLIGLILPTVQINTGFSSPIALPVIDLETITVGTNSNIIEAKEGNSQSLYYLLFAIYGIGVLFSAARFWIGIRKLVQLYQGAAVQKTNDYYLVQTNAIHSPFSFGNYLFMSNQVSLDHQETEYILVHEATHIRQKHTADLLLLELLGIFFWFNPMIFLYKTALRDQHEYLADQAVLSNHVSIKTYGQLLIEQSIPGLKIGLVNHLIYSQLKKRINMMTKKQASKHLVLKYATCFAAFLLVFWTISCSKDMPQTQDTEQDIFNVVEEMPRFPGCSGLADNKAEKMCTDKELLKFVYSNVKYPKAAKEAGVEGLTVVNFVITKEGKITDPSIVRDISHGCGEEALRVVKLMIEEGITWAPGKQKGKAVSVRYNLPIRFKLQ